MNSEIRDSDELDHNVRLAAFEFLTQQTRIHGEVLLRTSLEKDFIFHDRRVPLIGPQGIFKPAILPSLPLTITTVPAVENSPRPYDDKWQEGFLQYRYRGTDPRHPENAGLRECLRRQIPLIYLFGVVPGNYMPVWPVFIVGDDPQRLTFSVAMDNPEVLVHGASISGDASISDEASLRREYITRETRHRLHQRGFRERVLRAYKEQCAICRLRHEELLDAAHILPDGHPKGEPVIPNGLALCKLHHAAFDKNILGVRPDLIVELRLDILEEIDGPMLKWGLQSFQGAQLQVPRVKELRPDPTYLEERYSRFRNA